MADHVTIRLPEFDSTSIEPKLIIRDGLLHTFPWHRRRDYFALRIGQDRVTLQMRGFVGIIPINESLTIEVAPRVPLKNLARLLAVARVAATPLAGVMRSYDPEGQLYSSLVPLYAAGLRQQLEIIADRGFYGEYQRREDTTSFPRGRIDVRDTLTRLRPRNLNHRMAITYYERSRDNALNRCLLYAVLRLHSYLRQVASGLTMEEKRAVQRDLNVCRLRLHGISMDIAEEFLTDPVVTGTAPLPTVRNYYRPALELALAIIGRRALAIERRGSEIYLPSLVIQMSSVFEAYTREVVRNAAIAEEWPYEVLNGNHRPPVGAASTLFDNSGDVQIRVTPDTVLRDAKTGTVPLLIEAKYRVARETPNREDLEQTIAYGLSYRARNVLLLHPQGTFAPAQNPQLLGTLGGMTVYRYLFDLGDPDIEQAELVFTEAIRSLSG